MMAVKLDGKDAKPVPSASMSLYQLYVSHILTSYIYVRRKIKASDLAIQSLTPLISQVQWRYAV